MSVSRADLLVIGSGFGGSLVAQLAQLRGMRVVLVDRSRHPRFAIGESSTPIANLLLERISTEQGLPHLGSFARYGEWRRDHPTIPCGPKRGFAYFHHAAGQSFSGRADHGNELFVGSNPDSARADCQWLRSEFDAYLFGEACRAGVTCLEETEIASLDHAGPTSRGAIWRASVERAGARHTIEADFVIDATGRGVIPTALEIPDALKGIRTRSRTIYAHFRDVARWDEVCADPHADGRPFSADDATLHHIFDGGWMWIIRFDNGVTSAGFSLDTTRFPIDSNMTPEQEFGKLLTRFPSIQRQFARARSITPVLRSGRIQRYWSLAARGDWAMLPATAGFIDPFFSTGNAHTLLGVMRLADILTDTAPGEGRATRLIAYDRLVRQETCAIDRLVHGCFLCFAEMSRLSAFAMLYFLAATTCEARLRRGEAAADIDFLLAGDAAFQELVADFYHRIGADRGAAATAPATPAENESLLSEIRKRAAAYNSAGLCDPSRRNRYPYPTPVD